MKYRLIAIDMDGTLLNSENKVSRRNMETLHKAIEAGVYIVLSTGRILRSALYFSKAMDLKNPIIACNGAVVSCGDERDIIYENALERAAAKELMELAEENDMYYHFYDINTFYTRIVNEEMAKCYKSYEDNSEKQQINFQILEDPMKVLERDNAQIYKFVFIEEDRNKLAHFRDRLKSIDGINISSSWYNNVEVMNTGVSKGEGLKQLCKTLDIDRTEVVAIGDNENDIPMFQMAGLAVAMENGDEIIREHSHVITDTNDQDGVAKAIEKYVLNL
ncbi:Cof-type HAD-IIB family hydrolase [Clostridium sp. Cult3]|uniref:Cof-type HAD-IIB family hydrolase n=1 Tax=Clostridium sp. Cult3 TaxID=2079004 RepID=UPI001F2A9491|nr:Cof-type HAD-IIB family hydrolase [Clostridium sp. Cult3]MCF6460925.1 Cof-type HAD-IIB family hydrolase [Clostridium sp. Cult3]